MRDPLDLLRALLLERAGLLPPAPAALKARLLPLLRRHGLDGFEALAGRIAARSDEKLADAAVEAMLDTGGWFFRDRDAFDRLREETLPALHRLRPAGQPIRLWSAGCGAGQEAYSLAIAALESVPAREGRPIVVLATDLSSAAIGRTRRGVFTQFEVQRGLPVASLLGHFEQRAEGWRARRRLRTAVRCETVNLLHDLSPLGQFDVVFCRDVLEHMDEAIAADVRRRLERRVAHGGALVTGRAAVARRAVAAVA